MLKPLGSVVGGVGPCIVFILLKVGVLYKWVFSNSVRLRKLRFSIGRWFPMAKKTYRSLALKSTIPEQLGGEKLDEGWCCCRS